MNRRMFLAITAGTIPAYLEAAAHLCAGHEVMNNQLLAGVAARSIVPDAQIVSNTLRNCEYG